jgi:hypothetical protein
LPLWDDVVRVVDVETDEVLCPLVAIKRSLSEKALSQPDWVVESTGVVKG